MRLFATILFASAALCQATESAAGHWGGSAQILGQELRQRRFEAKGIHGLQPKNQTIADQFEVFLSSPVIANGGFFFGSGDGNLYAID